MAEVVGRLSEEPSYTRTETNYVPLTSQEPPQISFGSSETLRTPQSSAVQMETDPSPLVASPDNILIEPLRYDLQMIWLQRYRPWFPILHHTSVSQAFSEASSTQCLLQKAIIAVTIWDIPSISSEQKQLVSTNLRQEVILVAMESLTLRSVQSLLILSILFWGEGNWVKYSNLTAMCQRYCRRTFFFPFASSLFDISFSSEDHRPLTKEEYLIIWVCQQWQAWQGLSRPK